MTTLDTIRHVYVAQPFDAVRFALTIRAYLSDTFRRRRDQVLVWSRKDIPVAEAEPADAQRLCMRFFKPDLERAFLTAFVPIDLANAGQVDPLHELPLVQAELVAARQQLSYEQGRAHRLSHDLAEARRQADLLARQLREQDGGEIKLRNVISGLEDVIIDCRDKLNKRAHELRVVRDALGQAIKREQEHAEEKKVWRALLDQARNQAHACARDRDQALAERAGLLDQLAAVQPQLNRLAEIDKNNSTHYESEVRLLELD